MYRSLFYLLTICVATLLSASMPDTPQCKLTDNACLNTLANAFFKQAIVGNSEIGIESLAPVYQEKIEADLSVIKYTLWNISTHGFEKCKIVNLLYTPGSLKIRTELMCPYFNLNGNYEIDGVLITLPIQGKGPFEIKSGEYVIKLDSELKKSTGKDGKTYISIKNYNSTPELRGHMDLDLRNLFNGREDLAAPVLKLVKENYKAVAEILQGPVFNANIKKIIINFNKVLKKSPVEDFFEL